jgi:hypothetical protein
MISTNLQSNRSDTRISTNTFQVFIPKSKYLYNFVNNKTINIKNLIETEKDSLSTEKPKPSTSEFDFNKKKYDFLLKIIFN